MKKLVITLRIAFVATSYTDAQIRIKKKAEKKADQMIDDFLFGKKKKKIVAEAIHAKKDDFYFLRLLGNGWSVRLHSPFWFSCPRINASEHVRFRSPPPTKHTQQRYKGKPWQRCGGSPLPLYR